MRVTMTYADPAGNPASTLHRINDLTLKVTSPSSVVYWGNNGLLEGNWSAPNGDPNTVDTVERVTGERPTLTEHAIPVQTGVAHIVRRAGEGFVLVRP